MVFQTEFSIEARSRGYHLITREVVKRLPEIKGDGILHVFIKHSSAGLTLNENADPSVRVDFEGFMDALIPENHSVYTHTYEGSDDMPAHLKSSILGTSVSIPITKGKVNLGTWQGIYLCEFRNYGGPRKIVLTLYY
ncbi:MAG: secondary thiamine-phosphate synthase enzyme YjbQ [Bacteroidales bacterium]|jgi:secondary thiamine-phosphate synthase enzyme|nr:secondary thiamine-phosphate synthase enzyme YjbQ [Bacteroidales bacterium]